MMIQAKTTCPTTWTTVSSSHGHQKSTYECVDQSQESLLGNFGNEDGALFYHVEVHCGRGLLCLPFVHEKEVTCRMHHITILPISYLNVIVRSCYREIIESVVII